MALIVCRDMRTLVSIKACLDIADTTVLEDEARTIVVEHVPARAVWLCAAPSNGAKNAALALVGPNAIHVGFVLNCAPPNVHVPNLPENGRIIRTVAEFNALVPVSERERERLHHRLFRPQPRTRSVTALELLRIVFTAAASQRAEPEAPKPLPVEWSKRLRADTVEVPVQTSADDNRCVICVEDRARSVLFIPCDHCVCCEICARTMMETRARCPICREPVEDVRRIKRV